MDHTTYAVGDYVAVRGSRFGKADAAIIGPTLAALFASKDKPPTNEEILEIARDPKSPLHPYFQWDNDKAGDYYRRLQAGNLTQAIKIRMVMDGEPVDVPIGYKIPVRLVHQEYPEVDAEEQNRRGQPTMRIVPLQRVQESPPMQRELIVRALNDARAYRRRHLQLQELFGATAWKKVNELVEALETRAEEFAEPEEARHAVAR